MEVLNKNKKAYFTYQILDKYIAGIILSGHEVKSIKASNVSVSEAFCRITDGEIFVHGMHVAPYKQTTEYNPIQTRKLLLNKKEISKIEKLINEKGVTIVPLAVLVTPTGLLKLEIGVARGKKLFDKKNTIKEREAKRTVKIEFNK